MFKSLIDENILIQRLHEVILKRFPTDNDCLNELLRLFFGELKCKKCGSTDLERTDKARYALCLKCRKITSLTAKTFLSGIKKPRAYLMDLVYRGNGIVVSAAKLARIVEIATSSALSTVKKIDAVVQSEMPGIGILVDSRHFSECISKRSTHTPAKEHPLAELEEIGNAPQNLSNSGSTSNAKSIPKLSTQEELVYNLLTEQPVSSDMLCQQSGLPVGTVNAILTILELEQLTKMCFGGTYIKCQPPAPPPSKLSKTTKNFVESNVELIRSTYQGVSRKYLQTHLAFCWSIKDRARWSVTALVKACAKFGPVTDAKLRSYVSPPAVLLCPVL